MGYLLSRGGRQENRLVLEIDLRRGLVVQGLVRPFTVVEVEVLGQPMACVARAGVVVQVHFFVLDRAPKPFREDIVHCMASSIHADPDVGCQQPVGVLWAGELAPLIAVPDFRSGFGQSDVNGLQHESDVQGLVEFPTDHVTRKPVHDSDQVHPASVQTDVGDVYAPDLVWMVNDQIAQQVRVNLVLWAAFAQIGTWATPGSGKPSHPSVASGW